MPIRATIKGDLVELAQTGLFEAIAHGANCFHTMGSGIAYQIAKTFPKALEADLRTEYGDIDKLGRYSICSEYDTLIFNLYTQYQMGSKDQVGVDRLRCIGVAFETLNDCYPGKMKLGIPLIGAGLAGGNWEDIYRTIDMVTPDLDIYVVEWNK